MKRIISAARDLGNSIVGMAKEYDLSYGEILMLLDEHAKAVKRLRQSFEMQQLDAAKETR